MQIESDTNAEFKEKEEEEKKNKKGGKGNEHHMRSASLIIKHSSHGHMDF